MREAAVPALWVRPVIGEDAARKKCALRSPWPPFRKFAVRKVELIHLPHYIFAIDVESRQKLSRVETAVDAIGGHFAYWRPEGLDLGGEAPPGLAPGFRLAEAEAQQRLRADYRWALIAAGLRRGRGFTVKAIELQARMYYPFWTGYVVKGGRLDLEVMDAVSGARQGGKVREAVLMAILAEDAEEKKRQGAKEPRKN